VREDDHTSGALIPLGAAALYLTPSMIAFGCERFGLVLALNLFRLVPFGYVAALFMAVTSPKGRSQAQAGMSGMRRDDAQAGEALPALREPL
jgi:hypothetical protein